MKGFKSLLVLISMIFSVQVMAQTDFSLSLSPAGNPVVLSSGGGVQQLTYTIINSPSGVDEGDQTTVTFFYDFQIMPVSLNVAMSDPLWSCFEVTQQLDCDYNGVFVAGNSSTLVLDITSPVNDTFVLGALDASLTNAIGDLNPGDNTIDTDINFVSGGIDLELSKTLTTGFSNTVGPGDPISFDITVDHLTGPDATNIVVFDDLIVNNLNFDQANSSPECTQISSFVECNLNILPTGDSHVFTIAATVDINAQPSFYTNNAAVSAGETDTNTGNNNDGQGYTVAIGGPEIGLVKSIVGSLTEVVQGGSFEYLIDVNNTGVGDANNVVFTDVLPAGVTYQGHTNLGNFTCSIAGGTLTCTAPNLPVTPAQDGARINVIASGAAGTVSNTATSSFVDGNTTDNTSTVNINVIAPEADLDITIDSDLPNYSVGDLVTHNLTLHNPFASTGAPINTVVSVNLSPETVFQSAQETTTVGFSCTHDGAAAGGVVTCDAQGNAVPIGTNTLFEIVALANLPTPATSSQVDASVVSDFDPNPSNNTNVALFFINNASANLSLAFTTSQGVYNQGDNIAYTVQVENPLVIPRQSEKKAEEAFGSQDTEVTFTLPIEVSFNNADVSGAIDWSCDHDNAANGGVVTCDKSGIPFAPGSLDAITVNVIASQAATNAFVQAQISSVIDSDLSNNTDSYSDVINGAASDFSIAKTASGTDFAIGDSYTYVLTINNPNSSTSSPTDVVINDQLPAAVSFDNHIVGSNLGTTINCTHDGSTTGGLISCNTGGDPFPIGETVTIDINVTAENANNNVNNTATVETATDPDGTTNNNSDNSATVVINGPLMTTLAATKTASVAGVNVTSINFGQIFEYILLVENIGVNDAINVHVSDFLPLEVSLNNIQSTGWNCSNMNAKAAGLADVDCTLNTPLAPGNTAQIVVEVTATTDVSVTSITNQMETLGDNTGTLVTDDVVIGLNNSTASLTISQSPSPVDPESNLEFELLVNNSGTTDLTGVGLNTQMPTGFIYNGFNGSPGWTCNENTGLVSCTFSGTLASNSNLTLNLEVTSPIPQPNQSYTVHSSLSANELVTDVSENLVVAFSISDYTLSVQSSPLAVLPRQSFRHIIEVENTGTFDLVNASVLYTNFNMDVISSVVSNDFTCVVTGNEYTCTNIQPINIGQTTLITVNMNSSVGLNGVSANVTAQIDGVNKNAQVYTNIVNEMQHDLSLTKTASVSEVGQNDSFSYHLEVVNLGSEPQLNFSIIDVLPEGVIFQNASGINWTCVGESELNCLYDGSLSVNGSTQLILNVTAPDQLGQITNTANLFSENDENAANNNSSATVNVVEGNVGANGLADLEVTVEVNSDELINTEQVIWQFEIVNLGPNTAQNVTLSNLLPMGFVAESVQVSNGATCVLLSSSLQCEIPTLAFNETIQIMLEGGFMSEFSGVLMNTVEVDSDTTDPNPSNNVAMRDVNVTAVEDLNADLSLEINASSQNIQQGDTFDLSFMAKNLGPDQSVNPLIEGNISGLINSVQFLNTSGWACQVSGSNFACMIPGEFAVGLSSAFDMRIITQEVVQQSQPVLFNAVISSDSMDTHPANNMIGFTNEVSRTPTEDEIFALFQNAVGSGASETVIQSIRNVSSYCARRYFMAIEGLCDEFIDDATPENGAAIINAMEEITPNEVAAQSNSAAEIISSQFRNVGSRLAQLRGGAGSGFSVAGLNARYGNESIPLGMLAYLNQSEDEQQSVSNINDFVSPWGFFVNGSISMGERDATGRELGFDFDTFGLTAGVDYRFSPTKVAGIALGYADFDSEIEDEAEMQSSGFTLTGYGSFYIKDNFYVDARISYGTPDFEQKRRINFTVDEIDVDRVATGKTDADQYSVAMSAGYHFNKKSWVITPNASLRYVRTTIDAFQESGAGGFNFAFGEQEVKSMVWSLGASISKAISLKNGIISPQFDFNLSRETENDGGLLETRFINAPDDEIFWIGTDEPDRTFGSAGVGLVFIGANGKQAYINYRSIFGLDGFSRGTINLGARFEF